MRLREYQKEAFYEVRRRFKKGDRSVVMVLPTGGGKTVLGASLAHSLAGKRRVLWVAHRKELVDQAVATLDRLGERAGMLTSWGKADSDAQFQVSSVQALRYVNAIPPGVGVMVWDEAHHALGDDWNRLAQQASEKNVKLLGLTATPERADGRGLSPTFCSMVVGATRRNLIREGFLVPTDVFAPDRPIDDGIADAPVSLWEKHTPGTRTIVFCTSVERAMQVAEEFQVRKHAAEFIEGNMALSEREAILERFATGRTRVLCNCQILTEGFDLPPVQTVVLARKVGSASLYLQMIGRGSRPHKGKKRSVCLDLAGNVHTWGLPDVDREYSLDGKPIILTSSQKGIFRCPFCGAYIEPQKARKFNQPNQCPSCEKRFGSAAKWKVHGRPISKVGSPDKERFALDRWVDYALSHGKDWDWVTLKFVRKFGRRPSEEQTQEARKRKVPSRDE